MMERNSFDSERGVLFDLDGVFYVGETVAGSSARYWKSVLPGVC